jgi:ABC-type lipoprotein release transport system permease subunit
MFGPFERAVAGRYLRARRGERFVSVIAIFSLIGIALGVATLIIVMSVMGGFKVDLLSRILGFNGDLGSMVPLGSWLITTRSRHAFARFPTWSRRSRWWMARCC